MDHSSILDQLLSVLGSLEPAELPATDELDSITFAQLTHSPNHGRLHHLSADDRSKARSVFLTLHVLFPHHLLPALDLLDRGLVTCLVPKSPVQSQGDDGALKAPTKSTVGLEAISAPASSPSPGSSCELYYVQSSSAVTSKPNPRRKKPSPSATFYEVRLDSWNCSCPAFSVDAFQGLMDLPEDANVDHKVVNLTQVNEQKGQPDQHLSAVEGSEGKSWRVGGTATLPTSGGMPICKHVLAATLARAAPKLFETGVSEIMVSREQLAGWGGGWGEFGYA